MMYRIPNGRLQVLLVHPGGPFHKNKDQGAWSIPKGEVEPGHGLLETAQRELQEETGATAAEPFIPLRPVKQKGGKIVHAWACEGDFDTSQLVSNTFKLQWPPGSGKFRDYPEVDRAEFFDAEMAKWKINPAQVAFIEQLEDILNGDAKH